MLRPLGLAYITAVMTSLVVALTVIPALASALLPRSAAFARDRESWVVRGLRSAYGRVLGPVLEHRTAVLAGTGVLVGSALALVPFMGREFLPEFREGTIVVTGVTVPGTSIEGVRRPRPADRGDPPRPSGSGRDGPADRTARNSTSTRRGRTRPRSTPGLDLSDAGPRRGGRGADGKAVTAVPGTEVTIGQPIRHRIDHMLSGTRASIAINIYGPDLQVLREIGREVEALAAAVPERWTSRWSRRPDVPQVRVAMDRSALAMHGMTPAHLADAIGVAFAGEPVARVLEGQRSFDLVVRFAEPYRGSLERIGAAPVSTPAGTQVPLESLAAIRRDAGPNQISRENVQRKIVVQSNVAGRDVGERRRGDRAGGRGAADDPGGILRRVRGPVRVRRGRVAGDRVALAPRGGAHLPPPLPRVRLGRPGVPRDGQSPARARGRGLRGDPDGGRAQHRDDGRVHHALRDRGP